MKLNYCAKESDDGRKIISVLRREMALSASLIKRLKACEGISVNGKSVYTDYRVCPGDIAEADISSAESPTEVEPEKGCLEILFESEALIAVNKPCGMLTHPSRSKCNGTLQNYILGYLDSKGEMPICHAVNRLDRDTSGVVLFSKSAHFKTLAAAALITEDSSKEYLALVYGELHPKSGEMLWPIKRAGADTMLRCVAEDGRDAATQYDTILTDKIKDQTVSMLHVRLKTGRTHQIRVHCAYAGVPILGDSLYGTKESMAFSSFAGISAQTLHAERLTFKDPLSGERVDILAPMHREDMKIIGRFQM